MLLSFKAFNLDFYTEVMDLSYLVEHLATDPFFKKFHRLNEKLAEVIQDYGLVSFVPLNVQVSALSLFVTNSDIKEEQTLDIFPDTFSTGQEKHDAGPPHSGQGKWLLLW